MSYEAIGLLIVNIILSGFMWLLKTAYTDMKQKLKDQDEKIDHIKDNYFKKEDWKDFKEELWGRLDKMETSFESKIKDLTNK